MTIIFVFNSISGALLLVLDPQYGNDIANKRYVDSKFQSYSNVITDLVDKVHQLFQKHSTDTNGKDLPLKAKVNENAETKSYTDH